MGRQPRVVWGTWKRKKYKTRGMSGWAQIKSVSNGDNVKRKLQTNTSQVTFTLNSWTHHLNKKWALKVKILHLGCTTWYLESSREQSRAHLDAAWLDFLAILVAWTLSLILVFEELRCASSWEPFAALPWGVWIFIWKINKKNKKLLTSLARSFASPWRETWRFWFSSNRSCDVCNCLQGTGSALERYFCEGALSENVGRH